MEQENETIVRRTRGFCPWCEQDTEFVAQNHWLRDFYLCSKCGSIPRQRAVMSVLKKLRPDYSGLAIHESSPSASKIAIMSQKCRAYSYSYYYEDKPLGQALEAGGTNQNLEKLTFEDNSFDIIITEDVMEHVFEPKKAFREIARCLKPNGLHIFTTPIYPFKKTTARIRKIHGGGIRTSCRPNTTEAR